MIYGLGMVESGITFDYGQLVLDAEFARMIKHVVHGIDIDDHHLATDVIREVGPFGNFLVHPHTLQHMRAQSQPDFIDRNMREAWERKGSPNIYEKALEKVRHILETHHPTPLPEEVRKKIRAIVEETEKEMGITAQREKTVSSK